MVRHCISGLLRRTRRNVFCVLAALCRRVLKERMRCASSKRRSSVFSFGVLRHCALCVRCCSRSSQCGVCVCAVFSRFLSPAQRLPLQEGWSHDHCVAAPMVCAQRGRAAVLFRRIGAWYRCKTCSPRQDTASRDTRYATEATQVSFARLRLYNVVLSFVSCFTFPRGFSISQSLILLVAQTAVYSFVVHDLASMCLHAALYLCVCVCVHV